MVVRRWLASLESLLDDSEETPASENGLSGVSHEVEAQVKGRRHPYGKKSTVVNLALYSRVSVVLHLGIHPRCESHVAAARQVK
jgi:hypothetical protein